MLFNTILFAQNNQKVSLQLLWKHQFEFAGFYMAKEKGFYKNVNLEVELKEYKFGTDIRQEIEDGKSTFGIEYPKIILDKSNGANIVLLNALYQTSPHILITLESSGIKSIEDFKNKKIMMENNAIKTAPLLSMLYSKNINLAHVNIIKPSYIIEDLVDGRTDIFSAYISNETYKLNNLGLKYTIWNPSDYGFDFYDDLLFTSSKTIKNNPSQVKQFQQASLKGWKYAFENIDETVELILKKYNTQNKTKESLLYEAKTLKKLAYQKDIPFGEISKIKIQRIYDVYNLMGLVNKKIDLDDFIYKSNSLTTNLTFEEKNYLKTHKIIKMCNNSNWAPIEFAKNNDQNNMQGIAIDTLKILEKRLNIKFQNVPTKDWGESQQFLKDKKCDILPATIKTKQREKYANFTKPYLNYKLAIITQDNKPFIDSIEDIKDKSISRKKDSGLIHILKEQYPNINIIETNNYMEAIQKVSSGEVYCTITTLPVASYYVNKFVLNNLHISGYTDMIYNLSIAVRDDKPELLSILDKSLQTISQNEHKSIHNKWTNLKINEKFDYQIIWNILIVIIIIIILIAYRQYLLKKTNKDLAKIIQKKTKDLKILNTNLEIKIKEEVEKHLSTQEKLYKSERMAAMGEMIGNISHQWRQPLSVITTASTGMLLQKEYGILTDDIIVKSCNAININAQHLSKTIDDFKNFIKGERIRQIYNLKDTIDSLLTLMEGTIKSNHIEMIIDTEENIEIDGYENELIQCLINIFNNAKDVLKDKDEKDRFLFITSTKEIDKGNIIIQIQDTGEGIPDEILNKIFDPYFTTKHRSQGTGLGLNMSYRLINEGMHGTLEVENVDFNYNDNNYRGANFKITLPIKH